MSIDRFLNSIFRRATHARRTASAAHTAAAESLEDRVLLAAQVVTSNPVAQTVVPDALVAFNLAYNVTDPTSETPEILGLRVHYDSEFLTFDSTPATLQTGFVGVEDKPESEVVGAADGDAKTDRVVVFGWSDTDNGWPANEALPVALATMQFRALQQTGSTIIRFTGTTSQGYDFEAEPVAITIAAGNSDSFDIDLDGEVNRAGDSLLILRYLAGFTGDALIQGAVDSSGLRTNPVTVKAHLDSIRPSLLDVDNDSAAAAVTDGILIRRFLDGMSGQSLTSDAINPTGQRTDPAAIATFLSNRPGAPQGGPVRGPLPVADDAPLEASSVSANQDSFMPATSSKSTRLFDDVFTRYDEFSLDSFESLGR